jgi:hypothetical protein
MQSIWTMQKAQRCGSRTRVLSGMSFQVVKGRLLGNAQTIMAREGSATNTGDRTPVGVQMLRMRVHGTSGWCAALEGWQFTAVFIA